MLSVIWKYIDMYGRNIITPINLIISCFTYVHLITELRVCIGDKLFHSRVPEPRSSFHHTASSHPIRRDIHPVSLPVNTVDNIVINDKEF